MNHVDRWSSARTSLFESAMELCGEVGREVIRAADLILARSLAERLGLIHETLTPARLGDEVARLAQGKPPAIAGDRGARARAIEAAGLCAAELERGERFHLWSESSQAADPGRKGRGAFSTPPALAEVMVASALAAHGDDTLPTVLDPSVGHAALLLPFVAALLGRGVPAREVAETIHGVELDASARELCCLILWLRLGDAEVSLDLVGSRIVRGNALTASWRATREQTELLSEERSGGETFAWDEEFASCFAAGGFELVLANPPWESLRGLHAVDADEWGERELTHARLSSKVDTGRALPPLFSAQGAGDRNLFKAFVELFPHLLRDGGHLVALLPGAFSSDFGMKGARNLYLDHMSVERWTGFENRRGYFPIDSRYKFGLLTARRDRKGTRRMRLRSMASHADEAAVDRGHITLTRSQIARLGGETMMLPELADRDELKILDRAFRHADPFFDDSAFGPVEYRRELDLTLDRKAGGFVHLSDARADGFRPAADGSWRKDDERLVPLVEGRMVTAWDFYEKSWVSGKGRRARWTSNGGVELSTCAPQFLAKALSEPSCRLAICDVTSATNTRTMRATWVPRWPCGNTAPVLAAADASRTLALGAVLNSMTFDWLLRRVASGLHLNRFYLETMRLPIVGDREVAALAKFAATTLLSGRAGQLPEAQIEDLRRVAGKGQRVSAAEVEVIVASGYGMEPAELRRVMDPSEDDRRGLWRYFAAEPAAESVAAECVQMVEAA